MLEAVRSCETNDGESRLHLVEYANTQIRSMMDEARLAVWDLRRDEMAPSDLVSCVKQMADRLSNEYGVSLTCSASGEPFALGDQQKHELLMVAREALFNAILHGHPSAISTHMQFSSEALELRIDDDGLGFNASATPTESGHYGLQGMRERMQRLGGTLAIESAPNRGTRICATIPRGAWSPADRTAFAAL